MILSIPKGVRQTRQIYADEANEQGVTFRALVEHQYSTLNRSELLEQLEAEIRSGNAPTELKVSEWSPQTAQLLLAISTVVLAVELGI